MAKLVKIDFEGDHFQTLTVPDEYKVHDSLIEAESPGAWVIVPTVTGGFFCTRAGLVRSLAVEDEGTVNGRST